MIDGRDNTSEHAETSGGPGPDGIDATTRELAWDGRSGLFTVEMLDALDRELDRAEDEIETDLARISSGNMADYVARFVAALNAGAIEPEDFTPRVT